MGEVKKIKKKSWDSDTKLCLSTTRYQADFVEKGFRGMRRIQTAAGKTKSFWFSTHPLFRGVPQEGRENPILKKKGKERQRKALIPTLDRN